MRLGWWRFDLADVIPEGGMSSDRYTVGVEWFAENYPLVGMVRNSKCTTTWSDAKTGDRADGDYLLKQGTAGNPDGCTSPMLRLAAGEYETVEVCQ